MTQIIDSIEADAPLFDPNSWKLSNFQTELCEKARKMGSESFAPRAEKWDREASFPVENYEDLKKEGMLGICIPSSEGGIGADFKSYMLAAAEIGRYCGTTALTFNMHVCSCLWTGELADSLDLDQQKLAQLHQGRSLHYQRILEHGAVYSQPFSEGNAAAAGKIPFGTRATKTDNGWVINGKKVFASLSGNADYYGILATEDKPRLSRKDTLYIAVPANQEGVEVTGDWDPLGMRGTVSRTLLLNNVEVPDDAQLMPCGLYHEAVMRWPHMFMSLTPTYLGIMQGAFDFTIRYLRGEIPGMTIIRRMHPVKQHSLSQMRIMLEQSKSLWFQVISEAGPDPSKEERLRAYAAQYTVMENANNMCQMAIRSCGGHSMLKSLPLERMYRDSRCGSLMLPWTAEICLERLGKESLYEPGEQDPLSN
jgi:alkylation response protein AidB-like acyl-CoA dehydrogenase